MTNTQNPNNGGSGRVQEFLLGERCWHSQADQLFSPQILLQMGKSPPKVVDTLAGTVKSVSQYLGAG